MTSTISVGFPAAASHQPGESLRFERRGADRWPVDGVATAFCVSGEHFGRMHELHSIDYSHDGLAADSGTPIEPGTSISIGFQAPGLLARRGTVLRCTSRDDAHRIAVQFELRMAA